MSNSKKMSQDVMSKQEVQDLITKMSAQNDPDSIEFFRSGISNLVRNVTEGVYKTEIKPLTKAKVLENCDPNSGTLKISLTDINAIEENAFEERPNLESIDLSSNCILFVGPNFLAGINNLKKLILSFNRIITLEANTFSNVPTLEELELTNSGLKVINNKAFTGLTHLKRLILAYNEIEFIDPDTFVDLRRLELLVLSFNKIKSVNDQTFRNLANLKRLNLKANNLSSLSPIVLSPLQKCEQIILSVNYLTSIDNVFSSLVNLERLFVHSNKVAKLSEESFRNLKKCLFIDIGNNQITEIDKNAFVDLANLEYLDLGRNLIKNLDKETFRNLGKVEQLILSKNSISSLDIETFHKGMTGLKFLLIDFNKLTFIDPATFSSLSSLQEIYCNTLSVGNMKALQENIIKHNEKTFLEDVNHIASQRDISSLLSSYETFKRVERVSLFTNRHKIKLFKLIDSKTLKKLAKVVTIGLNVIFADLKTHIAKYKPFVNKPECLMLKYLNVFTSIIKNWSNTLVSFCSYFYENGTKVLLSYLNSEVLKASLIEKINDDSKYLFMILMSIMGNLLSSIYNLIKKEDKRYRNRIIELNAFDSLIQIAESFDSIGDFRLKSYLSLSELFDEKNSVKDLVNIKLVIKDLVEYIRQCASNLEEIKNLERCPLVADDNDEEGKSYVREALIIEVNDTYFYVTEFLNVLYNFAISDETKFDIYENCKMREYLEVFIEHGNITEREYALKLLWQLCFDKRVVQSVANQQGILDHLKEFEKLKVNDENKALIKNSKGVLWLLEDEKGKKVEKVKKVSQDKSEQKEKEDDENKPQIMISYNSKSRETCLKIKSELEKAGFRVWIDIESIYGSSLSAMAYAIETSFCVLMCVTEKYKESNFCRLEAEYLIQQKKPYIPLFLQPGYKPNGWLGLVIGSRIYIDFDKLGFDPSILELKRNINLIMKETGMNMRVLVETTSNTNTNPNNTDNKKEKEKEKEKKEESKAIEVKSEEFNWSEQQVENWMKETKINETIVKSLLPCDGQVLHQIYTMLKTNPEFYYSSMRNSGLNSLKDLKDVAYFSKELTKLFEK